MKYSLLNVSKEENGMVCGVWMQDYTGTFSEAVQKARDTEKANCNRVNVAVVDHLNGSSPDYSYRTRLKRLDVKGWYNP